MRYLYFIIFIFLFGCSKQEPKPELDYVRIEIYPAFYYPSEIQIDLKNKFIKFSSLQYLTVYENQCDTLFEYDKIESLDFINIDLTEDEIKTLNSSFNNDFLNSIKLTNQNYTTNLDKNHIEKFDGILFEIDIIKQKQIFSTDNYLSLEKNELDKIAKVINIIKENTKSEKNKEYIEYISRSLY